MDGYNTVKPFPEKITRMPNVLQQFEDYSSEDYLCFKLKPKDIKTYSCAHCGQDFDEIVCDDYCEECGEYLHLVG